MLSLPLKTTQAQPVVLVAVWPPANVGVGMARKSLSSTTLSKFFTQRGIPQLPPMVIENLPVGKPSL